MPAWGPGTHEVEKEQTPSPGSPTVPTTLLSQLLRYHPPDIFLRKKFFKDFLIYFWACWVFVAAHRGYSLVAVGRLLIAVVPLVAELGF